MSLGARLKTLRREKGWSQDELAFHAQIDGRQISRYENDRVVPSIDVIVKMAKAFDVSVDYLVLEEAPRRPLTGSDSQLVQRLAAIGDLSDDDQRSLLHILDAIEAKNKLKELVAGLK